MGLSDIAAIVGLVGGIAGILSWLNQRKQTTIMKGQLAVMQEQFQSTKQQEGAATDWARKSDEAIEVLAKICSGRITIAPSTIIEAYAYVFKDEKLRRRIEIYLGRRKTWFHTFIPTILGKEQLQNQVIQKNDTGCLEYSGAIQKRAHGLCQRFETALALTKGNVETMISIRKNANFRIVFGDEAW